jgi:hypothetical protein
VHVTVAGLALGLLDVTLPPFGADPSGARDATAAIQHAIDFAYASYLVVWFPAGRYAVSDTLNATQRDRDVPRDSSPGCVLAARRSAAILCAGRSHG